MPGNMVDRSTMEYWQSLFPDGYGAAMVRDIARRVAKKANALQALRRRAGSAKPAAALLAVSDTEEDGSFAIEASVRRPDGAVFLVQAKIDSAGQVTGFLGQEL